MDEITYIQDFPCTVDGPTVTLRCPLEYPDRSAAVEVRWQIAEGAYKLALSAISEEPSLSALPILDRKSARVNRLAIFDAFDFGSEERRRAIVALSACLFPPEVGAAIGWLRCTTG